MPDGDKGREGERANGTAATEHTAGRRSGGQAEGRQKGRRNGSRQGAGRERKKEIYKYLRERREEKRRRDSQKRVNMCIYISLNTVACWLFIALSFIYIKGVYCIYLYI